jgi:hypothetical protein
MPTASQTRYPALDDPAWLRERYVVEGFTQRGIATLVGCSDVLVSRALKRHGILRPADRTAPEAAPVRHGEPMPERRFVGLEERLAGEFVDLDVEVPPAVLERRLHEGLQDFAELARPAAELPRERLWSLVVDQVDAPTARVCVFTAAVLAAEQARPQNDAQALVRLG